MRFVAAVFCLLFVHSIAQEWNVNFNNNGGCGCAGTSTSGGSTSCPSCPTSCGSAPTVVSASSVTEDATWSGTVYLMGEVNVAAPATLTIMPGTTIRYAEGAALVIERDANIIANGNAESPISLAPADPFNPTTFQALVVIGSAPVTDPFTDNLLRTGSASYPYGGPNPVDSSGEISYVQIMGGGEGTPFESDGGQSSIDSVILAGVGSGTTINNIRIINTFDDGIEVFGGTVDISELVVSGTGDDGFDCDQGWAGTLTNFVIARTTQAGMEISSEASFVSGDVSKLDGSIAGDEAVVFAKIGSGTVQFSSLWVGDNENTTAFESDGANVEVGGEAISFDNGTNDDGSGDSPSPNFDSEDCLPPSEFGFGGTCFP